MPDRVVVFLDWQNVYKGAREAFCALQAPHWQGQVDPVALAEHLTADSPFSRELTQVRIYRGQPDSILDPKGFGASSRQAAAWRRSPLVELTMRTLRYPRGWPATSRIGERPQEKGIDVALAIDYVVMAVRREFEVGILMSTDTDMKPAGGVREVHDHRAGGARRGRCARGVTRRLFHRGFRECPRYRLLRHPRSGSDNGAAIRSREDQ